MTDRIAKVVSFLLRSPFGCDARRREVEAAFPWISRSEIEEAMEKAKEIMRQRTSLGGEKRQLAP